MISESDSHFLLTVSFSVLSALVAVLLGIMLRRSSRKEGNPFAARVKRIAARSLLLGASGILILGFLDAMGVSRLANIVAFVLWIFVVILIADRPGKKRGESGMSTEGQVAPRDPYMSKIRTRTLIILFLIGFAFLFLLVLLFSLSLFVILGTAVGIGLMCLYIGWTWNDKMAKILNTVSQRSKCVRVSMEDVCAAVPQVAAKAKWSLAEADSRTGHFRIEIGMSLKTWGQTMLVNVTKIDELSANVDVRCESHLQAFDWGRNDAAIERFYCELENSLNHRENAGTES